MLQMLAALFWDSVSRVAIVWEYLWRVLSTRMSGTFEGKAHALFPPANRVPTCRGVFGQRHDEKCIHPRVSTLNWYPIDENDWGI